MTLGDTRSDEHALLDTLAETLAEVKAVTLGETRGDVYALVDTQAKTPDCRHLRAHRPVCRLLSQPPSLLVCQSDCRPVLAHRSLFCLVSLPSPL